MAVGCEAKCAKSILISFNLILWLAGGTLLILGTWIFVEPSKVYLFYLVTSNVLERDFGFYLAYGLLSLAGTVFLVGLFGCCGAVRENRCLLVTYLIMLFLLMCVELGVAIGTLFYREQYLAGLQDRLTNQLILNYGHKSSNNNGRYISFSQSMDFAQYKFQCCGISNDSDYEMSRWRNQSILSVEPRLVPITCCKLLDTGEVTVAGSPISVVTRVFHGTVEEPWQHPNAKDDVSCEDSDPNTHHKARNKQGCYQDVLIWFTRETSVLITVAISTAALQVFGIIFSTCLCRNLGDDI